MLLRAGTETFNPPGTRWPAKSLSMLLAFGAMLLSACETIDQVSVEPFQEYEASVIQLGASADAALAVEQDLVYRRYMDSWQSSASFDQLQLEPGGSPFAMQLTDAPLFQEIQKARSGLNDLNKLVEQYAGLLVVLAGADERSVAVHAERVATELRSSAEALATSLNLSPEIDDRWFFGFGTLPEPFCRLRRRPLGARPRATGCRETPPEDRHLRRRSRVARRKAQTNRRRDYPACQL